MVNELPKRIEEAKKKMFANVQPRGGKVLILVKGDARVETHNPKVEIRKMK